MSYPQATVRVTASRLDTPEGAERAERPQAPGPENRPCRATWCFPRPSRKAGSSLTQPPGAPSLPRALAARVWKEPSGLRLPEEGTAGTHRGRAQGQSGGPDSWQVLGALRGSVRPAPGDAAAPSASLLCPTWGSGQRAVRARVALGAPTPQSPSQGLGGSPPRVLPEVSVPPPAHH